MSAWTQLYSLGSSVIKRPAVWIFGIIGTIATGFVTDLFKPAETVISETVAELSCRYRQKPIANESQFTILVSPLAHDPDKLHTAKIMQALLSEEGFLAIPLCEPFNVDLLTDTQSARDDMRKRAKAH